MAMSSSSRRSIVVILAVLAVICVVGAGIAFVTSPDNSHPGESAAAESSAPAESTTAADLAADRQSPQIAQQIVSLRRNDPKDPRALGQINAPVVMIEMSDYSCPQCAAYYEKVMPRLQPLVDNGTLRIEFHDFAIFDERYNSTLGSLAGIAAGNQGKFWEFLTHAEKLSLSEHPQWTPQLATEIALRAGVPDMEKFKKDLADETKLDDIRNERQLIASWGVTGTPAFFINDRFVIGAQDPQVFLDTIAAAKADAK